MQKETESFAFEKSKNGRVKNRFFWKNETMEPKSFPAAGNGYKVLQNAQRCDRLKRLIGFITIKE